MKRSLAPAVQPALTSLPVTPDASISPEAHINIQPCGRGAESCPWETKPLAEPVYADSHWCQLDRWGMNTEKGRGGLVPVSTEVPPHQREEQSFLIQKGGGQDQLQPQQFTTEWLCRLPPGLFQARAAQKESWQKAGEGWRTTAAHRSAQSQLFTHRCCCRRDRAQEDQRMKG